ncbi:hypothetical protein [Curtobacterium sp. S6]|nr:hypothetical protein [Curtobacterium sp. S6]
MSVISTFFDWKKTAPLGLTPQQQRKLWLRNFLKAFFVVFLAYASM